MRLLYLLGVLLCTLPACQPDPAPDYTFQPNATPNTSVTADEGRFVPRVQPPNPALDVPRERLTFDAAKGLEHRQPNGTIIRIPAAAFVDADGQVVTGPVDLDYREFHRAAEVLVSGIPMKATAADGTRGDMQTAGMLEIRAAQNGQPLALAPHQSIDLDVASHVNDGDYATWTLDESTGEWTPTGTSAARPNPTYPTPTKVTKPRRPAPAAPVAYRADRPVLDLDFNQKLLKDLRIPRGVLWQYAGAGGADDPAGRIDLRRTDWNFAELEPLPGKATYRLVLKNNDQTFRTEVAPTLKGKKLDAAMADYQQQMATYQRELRQVSGKELIQTEQAEFVRNLRLNNLGFHNFDLIRGMPGGVRVYASFDYGTGDEGLNRGTEVFLITNDGRSVLRYHPDHFDRFTFSAERDNKLVALLPGNRVATFSQADFDAQLPRLQAAAGTGYTFQMQVHPTPLQSAKDLDRLLRKLG